jgi:hypothetical protein
MSDFRFVFRWPELGAVVRADPLETNTEVSAWFADNLKVRPMRAVTLHTLVAGSLLYWLNLPLTIGPKWDEPTADKDYLNTEDVGRITLFMPEGRAGGMCIKYGPVTETMCYASFGQVIPEDIVTLESVGATVWHNLVGPKKILITEMALED